MSCFLLASDDAASLVRALRAIPLEMVLLPVLFQLALIVIVARVFFMLFRKIKQPGVVGEIAAGLILGPSVLGYFFPGVFAAIFHPAAAGVDPQLFDAVLNWILASLAQLGLVFALFLIGLEFDFSHLRWSETAAPVISIAGIVFPFGLGVLLAVFIHPLVAQPTALKREERTSISWASRCLWAQRCRLRPSRCWEEFCPSWALPALAWARSPLPARRWKTPLVGFCWPAWRRSCMEILNFGPCCG